MDLKKEGAELASEKSNRIKLLLLAIVGVIIMGILFSQMFSSYIERRDVEQHTYYENKQAAMTYKAEFETLPTSKSKIALLGLIDNSLQNDNVIDDDEMLIIEVVYKDIKSTQQSAEPADAKNHTH